MYNQKRTNWYEYELKTDRNPHTEDPGISASILIKAKRTCRLEF